MNLYKSGKWYGAERPKKKKFRISALSQPVIAACMITAGFVIAIPGSSTPLLKNANLTISATASGYIESTAEDLPVATQETDTQTQQLTALPEITEVFLDIPEAGDSSSAGAISAAPLFSTALSSDDIDNKLNSVQESERQAAAAADAEYRRTHANATVSSANRSLYRSNYHYGNSQPVGGSGYSYNTRGIPMSSYTVPDWIQFDENGVPTNYSYMMEGTGTAYYTTGMTATGTYTHQGTVAVDPREIPYGTEMWITSADGSVVYGYCRAEDTGGFIYFRNGATVDLYMNSYGDCVNWGFRGVKIYILSK